MAFEGPPIENNGEEEKKTSFRLPESSDELMRMIRDGEVPKTMMNKVQEALAEAKVEQRDLNETEREELRSAIRKVQRKAEDPEGSQKRAS